LERPFLGVEHSVTGQVWRDRLDAQGRNIALAIQQATDLPELAARILAGRGVSPQDAESFLSPALRELMPDPDVLTGMEAAAARLAQAVTQRQRVAIFGDYDVDGACSSALMARFLAHHGVAHEIYIPDRITEGYGPNAAAIGELAGRGAKLIVTVDCGSSSGEAFAAADGLGVDIVVLDHHQMDGTGPQVVALVNPNRQDDLSGLGHLCAAGIVFMTLTATRRLLRGQGAYARLAEPDLLQWLDITALATVCDVVPLIGLNRAFVTKGLQVIRDRRNPGLAALARVSRLDGPPRAWHLGFLLGPRINAGGRIGDAALGARLLTNDDEAQVGEIAEKLDMLNTARQEEEARMLEEAVAEAEAEMGAGEGPAVLIVASRGWHPGIVGLIAARLKERYRRPAIAIAFDSNGVGGGSCRSIPGVDIGSAVRAALRTGILEKGGGHAMAAGLTVRRERLADLRAELETALGEAVRKASEGRALRIDAALTARSATPSLCELVDRAGPFGAGNPEPLFAFPSHRLRNVSTFGKGHMRAELIAPDGAMLRAVAFRAADTPLGSALMAAGASPMHLAGTLSLDIWRGTPRVQMRISDAAKPDHRA
jgi:single-stranded-DNA-specific exonuclease